MASNIQEIEDDLNICPICFEQLNNPKCLPCRHTFCSICLKSYVTSHASKDKKSINFPCPVCRQTIQILDTNVPIENVVDNLPVDHLMLSSKGRSRGMSGKTNKDRPCVPCQITGNVVNSSVWCPTCVEALCETCASHHKKLKQSRHHEIKLISEVSEMESTLALLGTDEFCPEHFDKKLEVYCVDHKAMCCSICFAKNHRKCEKISTFEEMVKGEKGNYEENFKTQLLQVREKTEELIQNTTQNVNQLKMQHNTIDGEISNTVQVAIRKLEELKSQFLVYNKQVCDYYSSCLEERKRKIVLFQIDVKKAYLLLQAVCSSGNPKQIFITKEKLKTQLESHLQVLKQELKDPINFQLSLNIDSTLKALVDSLTSVGNLALSQSPDTLLVQSLDEFKSSLIDQDQGSQLFKYDTQAPSYQLSSNNNLAMLPSAPYNQTTKVNTAFNNLTLGNNQGSFNPMAGLNSVYGSQLQGNSYQLSSNNNLAMLPSAPYNQTTKVNTAFNNLTLGNNQGSFNPRAGLNSVYGSQLQGNTSNQGFW